MSKRISDWNNKQESRKNISAISKSANIIILSAKVRSSLNQAIINTRDYIKNHISENERAGVLADCAYTLQLNCKNFSERFALAFSDYKQLVEILSSPQDIVKHIASVNNNQKRKLIFGFVGQGPQYTSMAYDIYTADQTFREIVDECFDIFKKEAGQDLKPILFPNDANIQQAKLLLAKTEYAQPSLFIIEYALAKLLISLGVKPDGMIGHSLGEYVAATISGVFTLNDAMKLIIARSKLMAKTKPGVMLAVPLSDSEIMPYLNEDIDIAAKNAPHLCVVSGSDKSIANFIVSIQPILDSKHLNYQYLHTSRAFHSQYMDPIIDDFLNSIRDITFNNPQIPFVSNITGKWITSDSIKSPKYWATHMRNSVLFADGIECLNLNSDDIFVEIGPGRTLSKLIEQQVGKYPQILSVLPHFSNATINSYFTFISTVSRLWLFNIKINWEILYKDDMRKKLKLPIYSFVKQSYGNNSVYDNQKIILDSQRFISFDMQKLQNQEQYTYLIDMLLDIWKTTLGISKISIDDDFYALGGTSLLAVSLIAKIRSRFLINISSSILLKERTIRGVASVIHNYKNKTMHLSSVLRLTKDFKSKSPLFFIHPIDGTVSCYLRLIGALKINKTVYGLQDPSIEYQKNLFKTLEDQAAYYRTLIQKIQKTGPYYICGAFYGAILAMEIASQLQKNQNVVAFLGLIDGLSYLGYKNYNQEDVKKLIGYELNNKNYIYSEERENFEWRVLNSFDMLEQYTYKNLDCNTYLFKMNDNMTTDVNNSLQDCNYYSNNITTFNVKGNNETVFDRPNVEYLAEKISDCINNLTLVNRGDLLSPLDFALQKSH